jgi:hypothetical protein
MALVRTIPSPVKESVIKTPYSKKPKRTEHKNAVDSDGYSENVKNGKEKVSKRSRRKHEIRPMVQVF